MASPISSWEGAEAYFTYADSPFVMGFALLLSIAITIGVVVATYRHEHHSYENCEEPSSGA